MSPVGVHRRGRHVGHLAHRLRRGLDVEALSHTGREVIGERQRVGASYALGEPDGAGGEILDARVDAQVGPGE